MVMSNHGDDDDDFGVGTGEFGCRGRRWTLHGRRFFRYLDRGVATLTEVSSFFVE